MLINMHQNCTKIKSLLTQDAVFLAEINIILCVL